MNRSIFGALCGATLALGALTATQASAAIVDISAVTATGVNPVDFTFTPGQYRITWAGQAGGGAYDGYNLSCPDGVCPERGWRDDYFFFVDGDPDVHHIFLPTQSGLATFASALAALAGYQAAPTVTHQDIPPPFNTIGSFEPINQPWTVYTPDTVTVHFFIADTTRDDNVGGVSLSIDAVPEPATWALLIAGFAGVGATLRRRRGVASA